jgi:hypothetical protein
VAIMPVRTNHLERGLTRRQKRTMAIIIGAVRLGLWGSLVRNSYSTSANGCVNVTVPSSTGGSVLHYCGADARKFCHSSSVTGSSILAQHARPQCVLAGLLPSASAAPVPSH